MSNAASDPQPDEYASPSPAGAHPAAAAAPAPATPAAAAHGPSVVVRMGDLAFSAERKYPNNFIKTSLYEWYTFPFLNLIYQFMKVSNFYFLLNMIIALIPGVSPVSPATAVVPLLFVVAVAMVKDGIEEYGRHQADNRANAVPTNVLRDGKLVEIQSADVQVGDVMLIRSGEEIRADALLLSSTGVESSAFIETCNLDGETNLKPKKAVEQTWSLKDADSVTKARLEVRTGDPDPNLHHWTGVITVDGKEVAVGLDQYLYRSSILKNTEEAWAVVVYAGVDTKMFRNLEERPPKFSNLDIKLNWLILGVFVLQLAILILLASIATGWNANRKAHWYMRGYILQEQGGTVWGSRLLTYFIIFSYLIPISLFVTLELCKVVQAKFMEWDHDMFEWMHGKWQHCTPNTSNLNEQLSQIKFIFSDKTGTLTENVMKFKLGDALGLPIESDDWSKSQAQMHDERMQRYMRALALCHTINSFPDDSKPSGLKYDGDSPDELALLDTALTHGIELRERYTRTINLRVHNPHMNGGSPTPVNEEWEILATLKFTPDRKMMSLVVRNPVTNRIEIYTKGADSFVEPRLNQAANATNLSFAKSRLKEMAGTGLRTLMVCYREIEQAEFDAWLLRFEEAGKSLTERSQKVDKVCLELEDKLMMVGLTAIEDKLQDKVPETIQFFMDAGVIVWMLTGDKRETALTIAATSSLTIPGEYFIDQIDIGSLDIHDPVQKQRAIDLVGQQVAECKQHCIDGKRVGKKSTFVIDGPALSIAMEHHTALFIETSQLVASAVCCRLTPLQKANVVDMFQQTTGLSALAIGDGANDVPMISKGKVGIGIVGLEGAQAALAADYAIPRFKHLQKLCAVHGRYALLRNAFCVFISFYKNFAMAFTQFYYAFFCNSSGTTLFDGWLLSFFNFAFTSIPPMIIGMFEKDMPEKGLMALPRLFPDLADGVYFNWTLMCAWFGEGLWHATILFFTIYPMLLGLEVGERQASGQMVGTILMSCIVGVVLLKLALHVSYWQWVIAAGLAFSVISYIAFLFTYAAIPNLIGATNFYWSIVILLSDAKFYLYLFMFFTGLLVPIDLAVIFIQKSFYPTSLDIVVNTWQNRDEEGLLSPPASPSKTERE